MNDKKQKLKQLGQKLKSYGAKHFCVQGALHIKNNLPCQDSAQSYLEENFCLAVIADGHGSSQYFRSDRGSRFAVEAFENCVKEALTKSKYYYHDSTHPKDNTAINLIDALSSSRISIKKRNQAIQWFCQSILANWLVSVRQDMQNEPFTKEEIHKIPEKYRSLHEKDLSEYTSAYGSTLIAALLVAEFCLLIQIGDGVCIVFDDTEPDASAKIKPVHKYAHGNLVSFEPIPADDKCFLNTTTSLCDAKAREEFRSCYLKKLPVAVFVSSDGIEDCFHERADLHKFFHRILFDFSDSHEAQAQAELQAFLPRLSEKGSGDDMSLSMLYDVSRFKELTSDVRDKQPPEAVSN